MLPGETSDSAKREILKLIEKLKEENKILNIDILNPTAETIPMDTNANEKDVKISMESVKKFLENQK